MCSLKMLFSQGTLLVFEKEFVSTDTEHQTSLTNIDLIPSYNLILFDIKSGLKQDSSSRFYCKTFVSSTC